RTGEALTLPAILPLPTYAVRVEDDAIYIDR
ncbi:MAG: non-heme iron oxygenase ferredoxin subunit, partial [Firmicutes bacterium]|nr:non-heme iron oxygenase ferredoxin subunit [Bacillota bacterium]